MENLQIYFRHRPEGRLDTSDFQVVSGEIPRLKNDEVLCRTILLSIDPANRAWMLGPTYRDQLAEGELMAGFALCEVIDGNDSALTSGTIVFCEPGWQQFAAVPAKSARPVDVRGPLTHHVSVYGITGLTAYFGMVAVGEIEAGQTVLVSGAAGATGSIAGQIARLKGCRVVGVTGSAEKNALVTDRLGFHAAVSHRSDNLREELARACPDGIDVYFDNVGGATLEAALEILRPFGRIVCCGAVSQYDGDTRTAGPRGFPGLLVSKRLRAEGFLVSDFAPKWDRAIEEVYAWVESGEIQVLEDVYDGLETAPSALVGLLRGDNVGKRMVRVGPDGAA